MERFWSRLAVELGKRAGLVSVVGLVITLVLGYGITQLSVETSQDSYLNESDEVYQDSVAYQDLFGGQAMLTLITMDDGHTIDELFLPENRAQIEAVAERLRAEESIETVITPLDVLAFNSALVSSESGNPLDSVAGGALFRASQDDPTEEGRAARQADAGVTLQRLEAVPAAERDLDNPEWVSFLLRDNQGEIRSAMRSFFPDETHAQIIVRLPGNAAIDEEAVGADATKAATAELDFENASFVTTGAPVLLQDINEYLTGGMITLGAIAAAIMVVILLLFFNVRWRLLPLAIIVIGLIWAFGAAGYLGIPLTIVTIAGLPVMMGIGIDYAIQIHARVEEEVVIDRETHPIQETARNLGPALLIVTFVAVVAFTALRFAKVPMIRDFGMLLAIGIAIICIGSLMMALAALGIREFKSPTKGRDFSEGFLGRMVVWLGSIPAWAAIPFAVASLGVFAGGMAVEDDLVLQADPLQWVNQDTQVIRDIDTIDRETGSSSEMGIYVQSDEVFSDETVNFVHEFYNEQIEAYPGDLLTASSIVGTVSELLKVPGASSVAPTGEEVEAAYEVAPPDIQRALISPDGGALNIVFRTGPSSLDDRAVVVNEIRDSVDPPAGVSATPSGLAVVGVGLLENLQANRVELTYLAFAFVFVFLSLVLRSIVRALLCLVPVLIAVGTSSLVAWALGLRLSPMTAIGGPLVIVACTEFTALILLRFVEERQRGLDPDESSRVAAARTGRAFIVSALTTAAGLAVIATSSLPLLRDFGIVVALNVAVALLSALIVLPPMLVWADSRKHHWVSAGLLKTGRPVDYIDTPRPSKGGDESDADADTDAEVDADATT